MLGFIARFEEKNVGMVVSKLRQKWTCILVSRY